MSENISILNLKKLVGERLNTMGCAELPPVVRNQLETEVSMAWQAEATRIVTKTITPKRVAVAFAAALGVRRKHGSGEVPPPKPSRAEGVGG